MISAFAVAIGAHLIPGTRCRTRVAARHASRGNDPNLGPFRVGLPLEGELGRPRRKKPNLTVRTKYIGHRTASLLAEFDIWDVQVKYVMGEILKTSRA